MGCNCLLIFFLILLGFLDSLLALPLCTDSRAPFIANFSLGFCQYKGATCCNNAQDLLLEKQYESMNISDPACASLLKSVICARCDQFSADLYRVDSVRRQVPALCNSTSSSSSLRSEKETKSFCSRVWDTCQNISIVNSPFATSLEGRVGIPTSSNATKLNDIWQSQSDFCNAFGGSSDDKLACFDGKPVTLASTETPAAPNGMCLEKIGNGSYLDMVPHPDGSNRAFFSSQQGKVWLATIPKQGTGETLQINEESPFLDLSDEVHFDTQFGLFGLAFHPRFLENGRFFASFNCDKSKWPYCAGKCACNSDVACDPSQLPRDNGAQPCRYHSVIAEYTTNSTSSRPSLATSASPLEIKRIFTMGLPFTTHHGGQILFGPKDGYLYFMMGDGGDHGDPLNFAQNKKSLLGKIMRFDVDNIPSGTEVSQLGLWGNYSVPSDNPYVEDEELEKEIWALGFANPWRCSFDSSRPSYFICADVGQDLYEEVDLITKGGNYGWRAYEGPFLYTPKPPNGNTSVGPITSIFPVMGYNHTEINKNLGSASITGGYFYRSMTDPCINGRYLFADLYASTIWTGIENPINSGNFSSSKISFTCASDSPISCTFAPLNSQHPALSYIFSFGEDNDKDVYLLTNSGVYRIVHPSRCQYTCAAEAAVPPNSSSPPQAPSNPSSSNANVLLGRYAVSLLLISYIVCLL